MDMESTGTVLSHLEVVFIERTYVEIPLHTPNTHRSQKQGAYRKLEESKVKEYGAEF